MFRQILYSLKALFIRFLDRRAKRFNLTLVPIGVMEEQVKELAEILEFCSKSGYIRSPQSHAGRHAERKIRRHASQIALLQRELILFRNDTSLYLKREEIIRDTTIGLEGDTTPSRQLTVVGGAR